MVTETDLELSPGRTLHLYDTEADAGVESLTVIWHHGTPNTGEPPVPLLPAAAERGIHDMRLSAQMTARGFYDRAGYEPFGDIYDEVGIPHIEMRKRV